MIRSFAIVLTILLCTGLLGACAGDGIQGVSSASATNVQGAPGTAADLSTGGQANRQRFR